MHDAAERIRHEAAQWFARTCGAELTPTEADARDAWLAADPLHRAEYAALQRVWQAAAAVPVDRMRQLTASTEAQATVGMQSHDPGPRRSPKGLASALTLVLGVAIGAVLLRTPALAPGDTIQASHPSAPADSDGAQAFSTRAGERRTVTLADGTSVELSTRTVIRVHYRPERRDVTLVEGEAMFSVTHNPSRPFVVDAGNGQITVTGTRFDVRRASSGVVVAVESGSVKVDGRAAQSPRVPQTPTVTLTSGLGTTIRSDGSLAPAQSVDLASSLAWREGKLVFQNATLADVVAEVSRYRESPVTVADNPTGQLRVSSVFSADNTDALLAALPQFLPVTVRFLPDGSVRISSK
ncbi:DUF4880 domain-containing protein [Pandoraea fibrosis]|uniref:DUF4880 domain-containing protein n=1 Tax=Pandoraea fibrosis TaxID=1891094 RepID=A0ABX6HSJ3_9BURK|nr:FecR family protein [Pandoraea fibrosis]QHE92557.1 DUF4880 domain-containing protein [Pandoraea fibrosis]QHF13887.1 DUF4880 domain-containing protein [Pandoraea fibrosis]